jgi:signal transduction histidine kinase
MAGTEAEARSSRLPLTAWVLVATVAAGGAAAVLVRLDEALAWSWGEFAACLGLLVATALAEQFVLPLFHGTEGEAFSVTDALWVAAIVLADPSVVILAVAAGALAGQLLARRAVHKIAFNVGQYVIAVSAALLVHAALGGTDPLEPATWGAIVAAMAAYFVVNETVVAGAIALASGESFRALVRSSLALSLLHWAVNVAVGLLAAVAWEADPLALALLLVPLALSHHAYRGWLRSLKERNQMNEMANTADVIAREGDLSRRITEVEGTDEVTTLAQTLNRMLDRLEAGFRRERRFFSEASHELRTPLTICRGHLEILGTDPDPRDVLETVDVLVDELRLMGRVLDDMTTLANAASPQFVRAERIELARFLPDVAATVTPLLNGRLRMGGVPADATVRADPQRLTQALVNLLSNAACHGVGEDAVELVLVGEPAYWRFEVSDSGGGLPSGEEERVFEPFSRGPTDAPGSGLGLAIVRRIAEAHGGSAGVDNRPGDGTTFWVRLPR